MWHTFKICLFAHSVTGAFLTGYTLSIKISWELYFHKLSFFHLHIDRYVFQLISTTSAEEIAVQVIITNI